MNAEETTAKLALIGLTGEIQKTGHWDYVRVFAINPQGVTQGRLTIHKGEYSHAKWYVSGAGFEGLEMSEDEKTPIRWNFLLIKGRLLTDEELNEAWAKSSDLEQKRREEILENRRANPKPDGKRHKKLAPLNPRRNLQRFLYPERFKEGT